MKTSLLENKILHIILLNSDKISTKCVTFAKDLIILMYYSLKGFLFFFSVLLNASVFGQTSEVSLKKQALKAETEYSYKINHNDAPCCTTMDSLLLVCTQLKSQLEQKKALPQNQNIIYGIIFFLLIDLVGLLFFFFLEQKRSYVTLVKKNMEWASQINAGDKIIAQMASKMPMRTENTCEDLSLTTNDHKLLSDFIYLLHNEKLFLKPDLSLVDMAKKLLVNKTTLSKFINLHFHKSFPALLNEYRVREAIFLLTDQSTLLYTMEAISEMCGYRNRQVFHNIFKKSTGLTPSNFRKMSQNKDF